MGDDGFQRLSRLAARLMAVPADLVGVFEVGRDPAECGPLGDAGRQICLDVVAKNRPLVVVDVARDAIGAASTLSGGRCGAWAGYPMRSPDSQVLGVFWVADHRPREWSDSDRALLEALATAAANELALRSAWRREHELALALRESLLPRELPPVPGVGLAAHYLPAGNRGSVSGDFYDVFPIRRGSWALYVGDVCGKGAEAAALTGLARYTLQAGALRYAHPAGALQSLNRALQQRPVPDDRFVTCVYGTLRPMQGYVSVWMAAAGHPLPLVRRADGQVETSGEPGQPLGLFDRPELHETTVVLHPGDAMVFFTDGVTEARRTGEQFGPERLAAAVTRASSAAANTLLAGLVGELERFSAGPPADDSAILVLRVD